MRRFCTDRAEFDLLDGEGGRAEVFLRLRTDTGIAYRQVGPFELWYARNPTLDSERLMRSLDALAALLEAGSSRAGAGLS